MKKYIYLFLVFLSSLMFTYNVNALQNIGPLSNLTIAETGRFYNNLASSSSSIGYEIYKVGSDDLAYYQAFPTSSTSYNYNGYGGSIVQCGMSFVANHYYSVTFYWLSDSGSYYYHPSYTQLSNKLAIGSVVDISRPTFNYDNVNVDVNSKLIEGLGYLSSYTVIFKAPTNGTCLHSAFSSHPTSPSDGLGYVGYTYSSMGASAPSTQDIQNALSSSFNSINSKIDSSINSVNSNIDSMKDKQDQTNNKLDEANQTSKGILGKIGDLLTGIPEWFSNLGNSIGEFFGNLANSIGGFFSDLFDGIKSLFFGEETEECTQYVNFWNGFQKQKSKFSLKDVNIKPADDGYFSLTGTTEFTYFSELIPALEVNTKYTFIVETGEVNSSSSFYSDNSSNNTQFTGTDKGYTLTSNSKYFYTFTTKDDYSSSNYAYAFKINNGFKGSLRVILIKGEYNDSNFDLEYFQGTKDVCTTTGSTGGLFGIISDFKNSIGEWFKSLLEGILDGIKALFVPTDDQLYEIIDDSKELTENFGFVGESVSFFITIFTSLLGLVNANGCVELPEFSIGETTLFPAHKFWDKQLVCLNDNQILSSNISTIRTITSIVLVAMFINFAASKFFSILSKNDYGSSTTYDSDGTASTYDWSRVNGDTTIYRR